jgi:hypothetical protein
MGLTKRYGRNKEISIRLDKIIKELNAICNREQKILLKDYLILKKDNRHMKIRMRDNNESNNIK